MAKNSPRWNPSNLSVAHFLFSTGCTFSVTQVSFGMDTEIDFVSLSFCFRSNFYPTYARRQSLPGVRPRRKKAAVNYFSGNPSCANCDHVRRFLQARQMAGCRAGESLNQLELVLLLLLLLDLLLLLLLLPAKVTFSSPYSPQVGGEGRRSGCSLDHL